MNNVLVSDCTLGLGAELVDWKLPEETIRTAHRLLNKCGIELIDVGLLRSHTFGPNAAVYDSTVLPLAIERKMGTFYSMLLDEYVPSIEKLPKRSEETVDVIKVRITPKNSEKELAYCQELHNIGYLVCVLIQETAQYSEEELSVLIGGIQEIAPWSCFIVDTSGVMKKDDLEKALQVFDSGLSNGISIGFNPCDNLGIANELSEYFLNAPINRDKYIDASAAGIGCGAIHLDTFNVALQIKKDAWKNYEIPFFEELHEIFKIYAEGKITSGAKLGYYSSAVTGCSYKYTEYYSSLGVNVSEHKDICAGIETTDKLNFDKHSANKALMSYRKKRLNIIIIIPSANRPQAVDGLLFNSVKDLLCYGVDILIYDSSDDDRTYSITRNYQIDGYDNVFYKRYTGEFDGSSIDKKVITAIQENIDYDYIWCLRDGNVPTISKFYNELLKATEDNTDYIVVDGSYRNQGRICYKKYTMCTEYFKDNVQRTNTLGTCIFRSSALKRLISKYPIDKSTYNFWITVAPLYDMAENSVSAVLIIGDVFCYNGGAPKRSFGVKNILFNWGECWYNVISSLPSVYDPYKNKALCINTVDFHPFHLPTMFALRAIGGFNLRLYRKYQYILSMVSDTPQRKFILAAIIPKSIASCIVKAKDNAEQHPENIKAKMFNKALDVYIRIGR